MKTKKKGFNALKKKEKVVRKDPRIEEVYEQEVTFNCPVRGKVTQKVKIKRFRAVTENGTLKQILSSKESIDALEEADDGLSIYDNGEDLGLTSAPGVEEIE